MQGNILQQLEVIILAVLFSLLFTSINNRKAEISKAQRKKAVETKDKQGGI